MNLKYYALNISTKNKKWLSNAKLKIKTQVIMQDESHYLYFAYNKVL